MSTVNWMSWEGGVDLAGSTSSATEEPNVIVHVARLVQTPIGSAPAGMLVIPDVTNLSGSPVLVGFISTDTSVAGYFGPHIFAGTPFENAPVFKADIEVVTRPDWASVRVAVGDFVIETKLEDLSAPYVINREPGTLPFHQQGVEYKAESAILTINGVKLDVHLPTVGLSGGPGAVVAPVGIYSRL